MIKTYKKGQKGSKRTKHEIRSKNSKVFNFGKNKTKTTTFKDKKRKVGTNWAILKGQKTNKRFKGQILRIPRMTSKICSPPIPPEWDPLKPPSGKFWRRFGPKSEKVQPLVFGHTLLFFQDFFVDTETWTSSLEIF